MKLTFKRLFPLSELITSTGLVEEVFHSYGESTYLPNLFPLAIVVAPVLLFAFINGFHDAASVVATIIMPRALSWRDSLPFLPPVYWLDGVFL